MLEFWFLFPVALVIGTIAMGAGIGGAVFFAPFFFLILGLDARIAFALGLVIELFGFSSGLFAYWRLRLIHWRLGRHLLAYTVPAAIVGVIAGKFIPITFLKVLFVALLTFITYELFKREHRMLLAKKEDSSHKASRVEVPENLHRYHRMAAVGGTFLGLISVGVGEVNEFMFLKKLRLPPQVASGTSVFIIAITALVATITQIIYFANTDVTVLNESWHILAWTIPGVILGGQIGPRLVKLVGLEKMKKFVGSIFVLVILVTLLSL